MVRVREVTAAGVLALSVAALVGCAGKSNVNRTRASAGQGGTAAETGGAGGTGGVGGVDAGGPAAGGSGGSAGTAATGGTAGTGTEAGGSAGESAGSGGTPPVAGTGGGAGDAAGAAGEPTEPECAWDITATISSAIPTVGIVDWSVQLEGLTEARIEFTLNDPEPGLINVGSGGPVSIEGLPHRALLLGLKPTRSYTYRVVAKAGAKECTSPERTLTTGERPVGAPAVTRTAMDASKQARGFVITTDGVEPGQPSQWAFIVDADGEVVWWADSPRTCNRALMSWDGADMWMLMTNYSANIGELRRVSMDGLDAERDVAERIRTHDDFAVLPDGTIATFLWDGPINNSSNSPSFLVERSPDGSMRTLTRLDETVYPAARYHVNSLTYQPSDDTYLVADHAPATLLKLDRTGKLLWRIGEDCDGAPAGTCALSDWKVSYGHHLLANGNLLLFNNYSDVQANTSAALELELLDVGGALTANEVWSYRAAGAASTEYGDVQRLPNGNTLVVYSLDGKMHEVTPEGALVQVVSGLYSFGYANFRETLYGPPLR